MKALRLVNMVTMGTEVAMAWSDGEEGYVSFEILRRNCPCASCQGEPDVTGKVLLPKVTYVSKSFELVRYEEVGSYAVQFFWADGHSSGIYPFALLRALGDH